MYSYLFIYIYVLEVYTLTGVLSLIYLTCYGSYIVVIHICMPMALLSDTPHVSSPSTCVPVTSTVSFPVSAGCSQSEMLYVKVFLY